MPYDDLRKEWPAFRQGLYDGDGYAPIMRKPDRQAIIQSDEVTNLTIDLETLDPEQLHEKYGI